MSVQTQPRDQRTSVTSRSRPRALDLAPIPQRRTPTRLWHICRDHPNFGDQPCTPACVALCGRRMTGDREEKLLDEVGMDACVVCRGLDQ